MENLKKYIWIQGKRAGKSFPAILFPTLLLMGVIVLLAQMVWNMNEGTADKQKLRIALVGDLSDPYLEMGMYILENLDSTHFTVEFLPMSEEEAMERMDRGQITAYAVLPEGLIESIMWGENKKVSYVMGGGSEDMIALLVRELMENVSRLLVESQNAVYGVQRFIGNHGLDDRMWEATEEINLRYFDLFLNRTELYEMKVVGIARQLSLPGYYACSMLLLFLMLWGTACGPLFVKGDLAFQKLLRARGQNAWAQVAGEYVAYVALMAAGLLSVSAVLLVLAGIGHVPLPLPEWEGADVWQLLLFAAQALPVAAMLSAFQLFLFELSSGIISSVLLQFLSAICLGYLSGCFYPISFLPEAIQRIAPFLPSGVGLNYLDACMLGQGGTVRELPGLILCLFLFFGLTVLVRRWRLENCGGAKR